MVWACDPALTATVLSSYQGAGPLLVHALQALIAAHCALVGDHLWPDDAHEKVLQDPNYDFIVVGAGSAGAVIANRLSEVPNWKVLLVEAGGNPTLGTEVPQLFFNTISSDIDWGYKTQPQDACRNYRTKGACAWPRGKVLGGCSSINAIYYVRGNKLDYDEWAQAGNTGWSYEEVLPYFKKSENFSGALPEEYLNYHGTGGYFHVEAPNDDEDFEMLLYKAASELGLKHELDFSGSNQMGIGKTPTNTKDGARHSTARAFLSPIKDRPNLHVIKHAHATKLLFKPNTKTVSGVIIHKDGREITVNTKKEVIVSAGAINSPQLLMLSGIGPRTHLEQLGIEVKADLPVGKSLQDHAYVPLYYKFPGDPNMSTLPNLGGAFAQFLLERKGPFSSTAPNRVVSFMNTTDPNAISPDIQHHYLLFPPRVSDFTDIYGNHGFSEELQQKFLQLNNENFVVVVAAVLLKPKSKGEIILQSTDPFQHPLIHAKYFEDRDDLITIINALKQHGMKFGETETFKATGIQFEWIDLEACKEYDKNTDDYLECYSREMTTSLYHPTSTVKMGADTDETAVVNHELKVKSIKNLRVADASIMPNVVRGNTNAPTIMIGEKAADMIKQQWLDQHTEL